MFTPTLRFPRALPHRTRPSAPVNSALRLAAAHAAAREAAAVTGWPLRGLLEQTLEDTCVQHGKFCCAECFA
jgi:hypothetical protein